MTRLAPRARVVRPQVMENLRMLQGAPSVAMDMMPDLLQPHDAGPGNPDARPSSSGAQHPAEFDDKE